MVYSKRHSRLLHFEVGLSGMEIAILLLLTVPFTAAVPVSSTQRFASVASDNTVKGSGVESAQDKQKTHHAPALEIIPFLPDDNQPIRAILKHRFLIHSMAVKLRPRRAPQRGCQLGTCQLHNLANTLYHISKTNGKDESKTANDPQGYGR